MATKQTQFYLIPEVINRNKSIVSQLIIFFSVFFNHNSPAIPDGNFLAQSGFYIGREIGLFFGTGFQGAMVLGFQPEMVDMHAPSDSSRSFPARTEETMVTPLSHHRRKVTPSAKTGQATGVSLNFLMVTQVNRNFPNINDRSTKIKSPKNKIILKKCNCEVGKKLWSVGKKTKNKKKTH